MFCVNATDVFTIIGLIEIAPGSLIKGDPGGRWFCAPMQYASVRHGFGVSTVAGRRDLIRAFQYCGGEFVELDDCGAVLRDGDCGAVGSPLGRFRERCPCFRREGDDRSDGVSCSGDAHHLLPDGRIVEVLSTVADVEHHPVAVLREQDVGVEPERQLAAGLHRVRPVLDWGETEECCRFLAVGSDEVGVGESREVEVLPARPDVVDELPAFVLAELDDLSDQSRGDESPPVVSDDHGVARSFGEALNDPEFRRFRDGNRISVSVHSIPIQHVGGVFSVLEDRAELGRRPTLPIVQKAHGDAMGLQNVLERFSGITDAHHRDERHLAFEASDVAGGIACATRNP